MMELRRALIEQGPSLALQRAAADEIARQDKRIQDLSNQLFEARKELLRATQVWEESRPPMFQVEVFKEK